jgi:hypothetical protein
MTKTSAIAERLLNVNMSIPIVHMSIRAPSTSPPELPLLGEHSFPPEVRDYANQVMNDSPLDSIPPDRFSAVLRYLQACRDPVTQTGDYFYAQAIQDKIDLMIKVTNKFIYECEQEDQLSNLSIRLGRAREKFQLARYARRTFHRELNARERQELDDLRCQQAQELAAFDAEHNCNPPARYSHFSKDYQDLRYREAFCVRDRRFTDAWSLKVEADQMEQIEQERMRKSWKAAADHERALLLRRHQRQIEAVEERYEEERVAQGGLLDVEVRRWENAMKLAESRVEDAEAYNSLRARRPKGTFARISDSEFAIHSAKVRTANWQMKRDRRTVKSANGRVILDSQTAAFLQLATGTAPRL